MNIYSISYGNHLATLAGYGMTAISLKDYEKTPDNITVLVYDPEGIVDITIFDYLLKNKNVIKYLTSTIFNNVKSFLISKNVFDIYVYEDGEMPPFQELLKIVSVTKTSSSVKDTSASTHLLTYSKCIELTQDFLDSINLMDKSKIEDSYTNHFTDILNLSNLHSDYTAVSEKLRRESISLKEQIETLNKEKSALENSAKSVVNSGNLLQEDNRKLSEALEKFRQDNQEVNSNLEQSKATIVEVSNNLLVSREKVAELTSLTEKQKLQEAQLKLRVDDLTRQLDTLNRTISNTPIITSNLHVRITELNNVKRILYIKQLDQMPFVAASFSKYITYHRNKFKVKACMVVIFNKDSIRIGEYKDSFVELTKNVELPTEKYIFYMNDFSNDIATFIRKADYEEILILDLTDRVKTLTSSVVQKDYAIVNNPNTLKMHKLDAKRCLSFIDLSEFGVMGRIPYLTKEEQEAPGALMKKLKDTFFTIVDTWWG